MKACSCLCFTDFDGLVGDPGPIFTPCAAVFFAIVSRTNSFLATMQFHLTFTFLFSSFISIFALRWKVGNIIGVPTKTAIKIVFVTKVCRYIPKCIWQGKEEKVYTHHQPSGPYKFGSTCFFRICCCRGKRFYSNPIYKIHWYIIHIGNQNCICSKNMKGQR